MAQVETSGQFVHKLDDGSTIKSIIDLSKYTSVISGLNSVITGTRTIDSSTSLDLSGMIPDQIRGIVAVLVNPGAATMVFKHDGNVNGIEGSMIAFYGKVINPIITTSSTSSVDIEYMIFG